MMFSAIRIMVFAGLLILSQAIFAEPTLYTQDKPAVIVTADHPQFTIKLISNPTTGYAWFLREYPAYFLEPVSHEFKTANDKKLMGAPGYELWTFQVKANAFKVPQQTVLRLVYTRPWEIADRIQQVVFRVTTVKSASPVQKSM